MSGENGGEGSSDIKHVFTPPPPRTSLLGETVIRRPAPRLNFHPRAAHQSLRLRWVGAACSHPAPQRRRPFLCRVRAGYRQLGALQSREATCALGGNRTPRTPRVTARAGAGEPSRAVLPEGTLHAVPFSFSFFFSASNPGRPLLRSLSTSPLLARSLSPIADSFAPPSLHRSGQARQGETRGEEGRDDDDGGGGREAPSPRDDHDDVRGGRRALLPAGRRRRRPARRRYRTHVQTAVPRASHRDPESPGRGQRRRATGDRRPPPRSDRSRGELAECEGG